MVHSKGEFLKERLVNVLKNKILNNVPQSLKSLDDGMLVNWK